MIENTKNNGKNSPADFLRAVLSMEKTHSNVWDSAHGLFGILEKQYALNRKGAKKLLERLQDRYELLQIGDSTTFNYTDVYMDGKHFPFFKENLRKKRSHSALRMRENISADAKTFQVIHTTNKRKSVYHYTPTRKDAPTLSNENITFFNGVYESLTGTTPDFLPIPSIKVSFNRVILYSKRRAERVNIDFNITARDLRGNNEEDVEFPNLVIFESKSLDGPSKRLKKQIKKSGGKKITHMSKFLLTSHELYDLEFNDSFHKRLKRIEKVIKK